MPGHNIYAKMNRGEMPATGEILQLNGVDAFLAWGTTVPTDATAGYAHGCLFFDTDASGDDAALYVNGGSASSCNFDVLTELSLEADLASVANGSGASKIGLEDAGTFTTAATVEAAIAEIYQDLLSTQCFLTINLHDFRETSNLDVGNAAANGGVLASDTTPVLDAINAATDGCQRLLWAIGNQDQVTTQVTLPPDLDVTANIVLHARIVSGGTTDAVGFTLASYFNEGDTAVADTTSTNQTTSWAEVTATIAAADVPAGAQTLTIGLTPVAHAADTMAMSACWLEYTRTIRTS